MLDRALGCSALTAPLVHALPFDGFRVLHADAWLIVLDKAHGLLSVPGIGPEKADCLATRAAQLFSGARIVHRLDRDTSGVIVMALDADTHRALSMQFQERQTSKRYIAVVGGTPVAESGEVDLPIRKNLDAAPRQMIDRVNGRPSVTRWRVLKRGARARDVIEAPASPTIDDGSPARDAERASMAREAIDGLPDPLTCARLELEPITGRGHQLRVHLLSIGLPIVGDDLYAPEPLRPPGLRMLLHATELAFTHPRTNERLTVRCDPPF